MDGVITLRALEDNFVYLWVFGPDRALAIDPGDATVVLNELEERALRLEAVLATHHHADHTGGIRELKQRTGARIIGPDAGRIPLIDQAVQDGEVLRFGAHRIQVIGAPGHTRTSVCYYLAESERPGAVWTGDTLFQGGCGRLLEGDAETMWESLQRLAGLPDDTLVYGGHDYAEENYAFGLSIDPTNPEIAEALTQAQQGSRPSTMGQERQTNIFLLSGHERIKSTLGVSHAGPAQIFGLLRLRKDRF